MKNEHTSLEKNIPLTLYSRKGYKRVAEGLMLVMCERWVGDGERLLHIDPKFLWPKQHFFLILLGCSTGVLRAQAPCLELILTPASYLQLKLQIELQLTGTHCLELQLTQAVCGTWLYKYKEVFVVIWNGDSDTKSNLGRGCLLFEKS